LLSAEVLVVLCFDDAGVAGERELGLVELELGGDEAALGGGERGLRLDERGGCRRPPALKRSRVSASAWVASSTLLRATLTSSAEDSTSMRPARIWASMVTLSESICRWSAIC